jgi:hypothetical protein
MVATFKRVLKKARELSRPCLHIVERRSLETARRTGMRVRAAWRCVPTGSPAVDFYNFTSKEFRGSCQAARGRPDQRMMTTSMRAPNGPITANGIPIAPLDWKTIGPGGNILVCQKVPSKAELHWPPQSNRRIESRAKRTKNSQKVAPHI